MSALDDLPDDLFYEIPTFWKPREVTSKDVPDVPAPSIQPMRILNVGVSRKARCYFCGKDANVDSNGLPFCGSCFERFGCP